jgi:hypothetical protein
MRCGSPLSIFVFWFLVRENIEFRANEKEKDCSARKYTRLDPDIKVKERDKKRLVRKHIEFRANEREKDRSARKLTRENSLTLEKERLRKQSSRQNNPVRNKMYNKAIKRDKRKSTEYIQHESNLK